MNLLKEKYTGGCALNKKKEILYEKEKNYYINYCLIFIVGIALFLFINRKRLGNYKYYIQMIGVNKDITITSYSYIPTGYAITTYNWYIDLSKKIIVETVDYNIFNPYTKAEAGSHYSINATKTISDEQINEILKLLEKDNYVIDKDFMFSKYYKITYKDKTVAIKKEDEEIINKIIRYIYE